MMHGLESLRGICIDGRQHYGVGSYSIRGLLIWGPGEMSDTLHPVNDVDEWISVPSFTYNSPPLDDVLKAIRLSLMIYFLCDECVTKPLSVAAASSLRL